VRDLFGTPAAAGPQRDHVLADTRARDMRPPRRSGSEVLLEEIRDELRSRTRQ
jgi:hypothetical protein